MSLEAVCSFGEEACLVCGEGDNTDGAFGERLILMCSSCGFRCVHVVRLSVSCLFQLRAFPALAKVHVRQCFNLSRITGL